MSIMKTLTIDGQTYDLSMTNILDGSASGSLHTPTTVVSSRGQTVLGEYNIPDLSGGNNSRGNYSLIVGNGYQAVPSNALTLDWNGNLNTIGNLTAGGNLMTLGMAGVIQMFGGENPPPGWLVCDGSAVSRTIYPELFDAIGINWGEGDGSTTFNLPDFRGRSAVGQLVSPTSTSNLIRTDYYLTDHLNYQAYQFFTSSNITVSTQYTLQLWDVYVKNNSKTDSTISVSVYWGGGTVNLTTWTGSPTNDGITSLKSFTDYRGNLCAYAKHLTSTFNTGTTAGATPAMLAVYNSPADVSGAIRSLEIGKWMMNTGSNALNWQPHEWVITDRYDKIGFSGGVDAIRPTVRHIPSHTHTANSITDQWYTYKASTASRKAGTSTSYTYATGITATSTSASRAITVNASGSSIAVPIKNPYAVVNYIIATGKINI